ncbi:MAG: 3-phosphoserine/phosphohydroxythreonine transaminase [Fusobacteriaceae bacterium]
MERVFNFSAGPSMMPVEVLEKAAKELVNYGEDGMSVMEMSHRSKAYMEIIEETEKLLRELMDIPSNYKVLFLQGGASTQFGMIPANIMKNKIADYANTGIFAKKALQEAQKFGTINVPFSSEEIGYGSIPEFDVKKLSAGTDYFHITMNNTIVGTRWAEIPDTKNIPLVADMSSNILSEMVDVKKFGIIYAGAQKNIGPSGVTIVIVREDLVGNAPKNTPSMMDYKLQVENGSMYNTPPTYGIYMAKLMFEWIKSKGGVQALSKINIDKSNMLYDYVDNSKLFKNPVTKKDRSRMNVTFVTGNDELDKKFVKEATANGLVNLAGHRLVGGMRASIYNPMPVDGIKKLIDFMKKFEQENS